MLTVDIELSADGPHDHAVAANHEWPIDITSHVEESLSLYQFHRSDIAGVIGP